MNQVNKTHKKLIIFNKFYQITRTHERVYDVNVSPSLYDKVGFVTL